MASSPPWEKKYVEMSCPKMIFLTSVFIFLKFNVLNFFQVNIFFLYGLLYHSYLAPNKLYNFVTLLITKIYNAE